MDLYKYPEVYDTFHTWKTDDMDFILSQAKKAGGPVLELAAGTGRLALPIASAGLRYTGVELSSHYVDEANKKLSPYPEARMIQGDMCNYTYDGKAGFIFIGFNSLLHLETEKMIKDCFTRSHENLADEGTFLIDIFVPDPYYLYRDPNEESEFHTFEHPEYGMCSVFESGDYDQETQILAIKWRFHYASERQENIFKFNMHILYPDSMDRMLDECNFQIHSKYGDYDRSTFNQASPKQIYLCQKK